MLRKCPGGSPFYFLVGNCPDIPTSSETSTKSISCWPHCFRSQNACGLVYGRSLWKSCYNSGVGDKVEYTRTSCGHSRQWDRRESVARVLGKVSLLIPNQDSLYRPVIALMFLHSIFLLGTPFFPACHSLPIAWSVIHVEWRDGRSLSMRYIHIVGPGTCVMNVFWLGTSLT